MLPVETPFKIYTGLDGKPLHNGFVYFGQPNQNPIAAPVTVYWDAAGTQPAAQPLPTVNGYIVRAGTPANVFCGVSYSELVKDSKGRQVFYARTSDDFSIAGQVLQFFTSLGSSLIGFIQSGIGAVMRTVQDKLRETVHAEDYDTLAHAITAAAGKNLILNHAYAIDNSAGAGLVIAVDNIRFSGEGTINFSSIANSGIKVTGKNVTIEDITVRGPGAYNSSAAGAVEPGLIYIDGTGLTGPINCRIQNVKVLEPGRMGIVAYKAVGVEIINNRVENSLPVATWLNTSNNHLIRIYSCANYKVQGNRLQGFSEGIVIQAYPAVDYVFDDFSGTTGNKTRKGIVSDNIVVGTYDHCIYFSNDNEHYACNGNFLWMASVAEGGEGTCSLKLEGGYFEAIGNYSREGIQMRNPYFGDVSHNIVTIYSGRGGPTNPSKIGILCQDVIFQRGLAGMSINGNTVAAIGAIDVDAGIWIEGAVWSGYQSQITDLSVCNNKIYGVGQNSAGGNGCGILIHQDMPLVAGVVSGSTGTGVTVCGNTINMSTFTAYTGGTGSYGIELLNIDFATVTGNTVRNFSQRGISLLGLRYSMVGGNNLIGNAASASQRFATFEDASNTAVHVDSVSNTYGINHAENIDIKYFPAHQSTVCADLLPLVNAGAVNFNQTISSYDVAQVFLWAPTAVSLTLTLSVGRPWGVGQKLDVVNKGTQSFTVTNSGTVIAANTKVTFLCTGANTFITYV